MIDSHSSSRMKSPLLKSLLLGLWLILTTEAAAASTDASSWQGQIASRTLAISTQLQRRRQLLVPPSRPVRIPKLLPGGGLIFEQDVKQERATLKQGENNNDVQDGSCDVAFYECLTSSACADCFSEMRNKQVDWTGVTEDTDCNIVLPILTKAGLCPNLEGNTRDKNLFCNAFHACVYFDDDDAEQDSGNDNKKQNDKDKLDCQTLTECKWPGIHESFIGDGVCHDNYGNSCYNSAVCNWDGGDCCKDSCKSEKGSYLQCGSDGYACRDPSSASCDPSLTNMCPSDKNNDNNNGKDPPKCDKDKTLYRLEMYDSFGDGWEGTTITVTVKNGGTKPVFTGALESGAQGTEYVCLSVDPKCYIVETTGGMWGREASWDVRAYADGSPVLASGGGSMKCEFLVAGATDCENSCWGKNNVDPNSDPDYKDFKKMINCIDEKCLIQAEACRNDEACKKCFDEDVPEYCYSIASFNAVADCTMCNCLGADFDLSEFCDKKSAPGTIPIKPASGGQNLEPRQCSPSEVLDGSAALIDFSLCMHNSQEQFMVSEFDENNFGDLDTFETCAHGFQDQPNHGGHTALDCMQILANAINEQARPGEPTEAISQLASLLYNEGTIFCDCAKKASDECPLCPSFYNFKTLLYEALDACQSLDMIDCDAWNEFQEPCKVNLMAKFGSVNLGAKEQCDFMTGNCGGAGPFPSFRRLDCQSELPDGSWDFYKEFEKFCYQGNADPEPPSAPVPLPPPVPLPAPVPTPQMPVKGPTYYENIKPSIRPPAGDRKPYIPPEERGKPTYKSPDEKKSSHWFRNLVLICLAGGIGYYFYKRRSEFSMVRYRRIGGLGGGFGFRGGGGGFNVDDGDMYSGLSLESSTNFEPPSLPPTPMSMPSNGGYGA